MRPGYCLLVILLLVGVARVVSVCNSSNAVSYNATVEWSCSGGQQHCVECQTLNDALDFSTNNITATCRSPNIIISL